MSTNKNTPSPASAPSWADNEFPQPDGTTLFTSDPRADRREGKYQLDTELFWSTDAPAVKTHIVITPHLDELELDAAGIDALIGDLRALATRLRDADEKAELRPIEMGIHVEKDESDCLDFEASGGEPIAVCHQDGWHLFILGDAEATLLGGHAGMTEEQVQVLGREALSSRRAI
ncbi:hypothetical protein BJF77_11025 [Kocuria sp. CNJ-770]|uniref:hypothetical protein n=1 Tax=Kocuria sp. CNJ-770 TaxID=1904964 RepID=UPI0009620823|nr:hypothetical protein [Kocuria sp. CNJ-770]OLT09312.1 hypothetical protein BJF77_11025 [Kocuria sp. CNJ-770]